jgi:hypothetical protein
MTCFGWRPQLTADPVRKERRMRSINATKVDRYHPALFGLTKLQKTLERTTETEDLKITMFCTRGVHEKQLGNACTKTVSSGSAGPSAPPFRYTRGCRGIG